MWIKDWYNKLHGINFKIVVDKKQGSGYNTENGIYDQDNQTQWNIVSGRSHPLDRGFQRPLSFFIGVL